MKVVILAGGLGTRLSEETELRPKPMVEIGGRPILWHIMKIYGSYGFTDFIVCLGYKGEVIKDYFVNYYRYSSDLTVDLQNNSTEFWSTKSEPWKVTLVDTGHDTMTGGRLKRIQRYLDDDNPFCMTYGDGVGNINLRNLVEFHNKSGLKATVTVTVPPGRFGELSLDGPKVTSFKEKPNNGPTTINGGFFILRKDVLDYIDGDSTVWEDHPLEQLAKEGQLGAYRHSGFWQPMDTLRDKKFLESLWNTGKAPWKIWE